MTSVGTSARSRAGTLYVVAIGASTAVLCVLANAGVIAPGAVWLVAVPLGPVGLAVGVALLIVGAGVDVTGASSPWTLVGIDALVVAAALFVALGDVAIVTRIQRRIAGSPVPATYRGWIPLVGDRVLGGGAFVTAAALHVLLWVVAGFFAALAGGVDVPAPAEQAAAVRLVCAVAWLLGSIAAVGGLVAWVVTARRGLAMLRWALADVGVQTIALVAIVALADLVG